MLLSLSRMQHGLSEGLSLLQAGVESGVCRTFDTISICENRSASCSTLLAKSFPVILSWQPAAERTSEGQNQPATLLKRATRREAGMRCQPDLHSRPALDAPSKAQHAPTYVWVLWQALPCDTSVKRQAGLHLAAWKSKGHRARRVASNWSPRYDPAARVGQVIPAAGRQLRTFQNRTQTRQPRHAALGCQGSLPDKGSGHCRWGT